MTNEHLEKSFTVSGPAHLELSNIRGSVDIRPGVEDVILVKAEKQVDTGNASQTTIEMTQESDGTVKVKTRFPEDWLDLLFGAKPCKVDYVVTAPRACQLRINGVSNTIFVEGFEGDSAFKTVSGDLTLRSLNGALSFDTVSGDLNLSELRGDFRLNTVSGDVKGVHLNGAVHLKTVSGDVEFKESELPSFSATTVSGELDLETSLSAGPYTFNSVSGDLAIKLPAETRCTAELHTTSGELSIQLPTTSVTHQHGRHVAEIQGGGVKVLLNSVSGSMQIMP